MKRRKLDQTIRVTPAAMRIFSPPPIRATFSVNIDVAAMQQAMTPPQIQAVMNGLAQIIAAQK